MTFDEIEEEKPSLDRIKLLNEKKKKGLNSFDHIKLSKKKKKRGPFFLLQSTTPASSHIIFNNCIAEYLREKTTTTTTTTTVTMMRCVGLLLLTVVAVRSAPMDNPTPNPNTCKLTDFKTCDDSGRDVVKSLEFNGTCEKKTPVLVINNVYKIDITFVPDQDAQYAKTDVRAKLGPMLIHEDVGNPNACKHKGLDCPLKADEKYTYMEIINVRTILPIHTEMRLSLLWSLLDEAPKNKSGKKTPIFCIEIPIILKPSENAEGDILTPLPPSDQNEPSFKVVN